MNLKINLGLLFFICIGLGQANAQNSINIAGNQSNNLNQNNIQKCESGYLAFGTFDQLGVQHFSFETGMNWSMNFKVNNIPMYGTMGCMENDSVFLVLGRDGTSNTAIIKATTSGKVIWSNWYSTGTDEKPDKIVRLKNGDYLVSTRTNISYYEFGEWGSRSCVFRIDANGKLLWSRLLDYRSANTYSLVLGMHETDNNNILITQIYNNKLGLYKLSPAGDSLKSMLSSQDFTGVASAFDSKSQNLFLASADKKIVKLDTSFGVLWHKNIAHSNLNSLNYIFLPTDSTIALGGKYNNDAVIINLDNAANVDKAYYKRFVYSTPSTLLGIFYTNNQIISLISQGFAVTKHANNLSNDCFNTVNGSQFTTGSLSNLTFVAGIPIKGTATYDELKNVSIEKSYQVVPSSNCLLADLGLRAQGDYSARFCEKFDLKMYVSNYSAVNITKFNIKVDVGGKFYDSLFAVNLGSGASISVNMNQLALQEGENIIKGYVYMPQDTTDFFNSNDTFTLTVNTKKFSRIKLSGNDSICANAFSKITISGAVGTFAWYNNNKLVAQNSSQFYQAQNKGTYYVVFSDSGCSYLSDTFELFHYPTPKKPVITLNGNNLDTDADAVVYWFYNGALIDSLKNSIVPKSSGNYKVKSINKNGCYNESSDFNFSSQLVQLFNNEYFKLINNHLFYWKGPESIDLTCINSKGQIIYNSIMLTGETMDANLEAGIYLVRIKNKDKISYTKVLILE